jgi:hypothetical protein
LATPTSTSCLFHLYAFLITSLFFPSSSFFSSNPCTCQGTDLNIRNAVVGSYVPSYTPYILATLCFVVAAIQLVGFFGIYRVGHLFRLLSNPKSSTAEPLARELEEGADEDLVPNRFANVYMIFSDHPRRNKSAPSGRTHGSTPLPFCPSLPVGPLWLRSRQRGTMRPSPDAL